MSNRWIVVVGGSGQIGSALIGAERGAGHVTLGASCSRKQDDLLPRNICEKPLRSILPDLGEDKWYIYLRMQAGLLGFMKTVSPCICSIKKLRLFGKTELFTIQEIAKFGLEEVYEAANYRDASVVIVDNTPEEIRDVAMEMHEILGGQVGYSEVDEILQEQFWRQFPFIASKYGTARLCRVGRQSLLNSH